MKRITIFALIIVISVSVNFSTVAAQVCGNYDSDPNGDVDLADLTFLLSYLLFGIPATVGDIDIDDFEGATVRDFLFLQNHLGINFDPLVCPPSNPRMVAIPDSSLSVSYSKRIPAGSESIKIPIYFSTERDFTCIQFPMQFRIDNSFPLIDSLHVSDMKNANVHLGWTIPATGEVVINLITLASTFGFPDGVDRTHIANVFLSYPPSNLDRTLTANWTILSPIQVSPPDSTVIPAVYSSVSSGAVAWEPVLKEFICGDVDGSGGQPDIADLTFLIDHLFINFPPLANPLTGNVDGSQNGDGSSDVDIADLTFLIDHLFINFPQIGC